jgi:hypothetical protein
VRLDLQQRHQTNEPGLKFRLGITHNIECPATILVHQA